MILPWIASDVDLRIYVLKGCLSLFKHNQKRNDFERRRVVDRARPLVDCRPAQRRATRAPCTRVARTEAVKNTNVRISSHDSLTSEVRLPTRVLGRRTGNTDCAD